MTEENGVKFLPALNTVLLLIILLSQWQMMQKQENRVIELDLQYEQLSMQLDRLEAEQNLMASQLSKWQGESLEAKVEEAGEAVVTGWQMLMSTMARELEKASEQMQKSTDSGGRPSSEMNGN